MSPWMGLMTPTSRQGNQTCFSSNMHPVPLPTTSQWAPPIGTSLISCQDNHMSLSFSVDLVHLLLPPTVCSLHSNQQRLLRDLQTWSLSGSLTQASYHTWNETQASPNHLACSSSHCISNHCVPVLHTPAAAGVPCQTRSRLRALHLLCASPDPVLPGFSSAP